MTRASAARRLSLHSALRAAVAATVAAGLAGCSDSAATSEPAAASTAAGNSSSTGLGGTTATSGGSTTSNGTTASATSTTGATASTASGSSTTGTSASTASGGSTGDTGATSASAGTATTTTTGGTTATGGATASTASSGSTTGTSGSTTGRATGGTTGDGGRGSGGSSASDGGSNRDASGTTGGSRDGSTASTASTSSTGSTTGATTGSTGEVPLDPTLLSQCTGTNPILCAINKANGNYNVTVELGSASAAATTRVEAETRRIELQPTATAAGAFFRYTFTVNVRAEQHDGYSAPGGVLNLSFDGTAPALHGVGVAAASVPTIYIAGDSTQCDWDPAVYNPFAPDGTDVSGWGQELSQYLVAGIAVANYADSGETAGSFYTKFYPPAKAAMKAGDFLFVQFGHNDMKTDSSATYRTNLLKYITDARAKSVTPVLITPVSRSSGANFAATDGVALDQTMRDLAMAESVALLDLTQLSLTYYGTLSSTAKSALFVDGTHFHEPGATQIANLVAKALKGMTVGVERFVK